MSILFPFKVLLETAENKLLADLEVNTQEVDFIENKEQAVYQYDDQKRIELIHCVTSIVDNAIDQIHILSGGKRSDKVMTKINETLEERAKKSFIDDPIFEIETGDPYKVAFQKKKIRKVLEDSAKVKEFLIIIRNELKDNQSYKCVEKIIQDLQCRRNDEKQLLKDEAENFLKMKNLKHMLITQSRDCQRELQKVNEAFAISKDQTQDLLFENLIRTRYIKEWEDARNEQNNIICEKGEGELEDIISKYKLEIEKEIRINMEIDLYLHENLKDMEISIDNWIARYEKEVESLNVDIQLLKERREDQTTAYEALKELYALHKKQIEDFLAYKEKKRKEEEFLEMLNQKATKIQAWWRGVMVRRQLGPYNPNPKKKGKKGKGKGKGKDKKGKKK